MNETNLTLNSLINLPITLANEWNKSDLEFIDTSSNNLQNHVSLEVFIVSVLVLTDNVCYDGIQLYLQVKFNQNLSEMPIRCLCSESIE